MRALSFAFFAIALPAQVSAPAPQRQWLTDLQNIQQEMQEAPLGSLDAKVERAWRAALEVPQDPEFQMAAQMTSSFYQSQGYDLKAEEVLRQALAATPEADAQTRRNLTSQLASYFESTQQLVKALTIREAMAKEPPPPATNGYTPASYEAITLANLYERMGEFEKAEAAWQEVAARRAAEAAQKGSDSRLRTAVGPFSLGYRSGGQNELAAFYSRRGRAAEAELLYKKDLADAAQSSSPYQWNSAAEDYIGFLSQQRRFDEAVDLTRQSIARIEASSDPHANQVLHWKHQHLANLLTQAGRADEARAAQKEADEAASQLRESAAVPNVTAPNRVATVYDIVGPAQQAAIQGSIEVAVAAADKAVALAAERSRTNPQEVAGLMSLASVLLSKEKETEARRIAAEGLRILEQVPDHPRVADALGSVTSAMANLGMTAEAERAIDREEKILVSAKGAESEALNSVSYGRIALMQRDTNWTGVIDERKRMLARTEKATGSKSRESLYALREVAWAYPPLNNWPEEEGVLATLIERTVSVSGQSSLDHAHALVHTANRASQNREFDKALSWIDQAIEVARALPDASVHLPAMVQNRAQIVKATNAPPGAAAPNGDGRWFDNDRFQRTDGTRLGNRPAGALVVGPPGGTRSGQEGDRLLCPLAQLCYPGHG
ncbi:MAG TPA: hypothetical protein VLE24_02490 [Methyloceanibacter sp.]|nr:hypothetical protein [Methyloceanibacter sp.]